MYIALYLGVECEWSHTLNIGKSVNNCFCIKNQYNFVSRCNCWLRACVSSSGIFLPSSFDNVLMTLVLVVFDKLSTGQPDFLRYICPVLLFLPLAIPKSAQPKEAQKNYNVSLQQQKCSHKTAAHGCSTNSLPFFKWQYDQMLVQPKQGEGEKTLVSKNKNPIESKC